MRYHPHKYQTYAAEFIKDRNAAGLFLEMGLGKTVITLTALSDLIKAGQARRILVIAPLRVAQTVWSEEAAKWDHLQHLRISKVLGTSKERMTGLEAAADIYVINRENVLWLVSTWPWDFDTVVIDELSSFKARSAQRFKALRLVRSRIQRIYGLTGTPTSNGLIDLWSQIWLLDRGAALGQTLGGYRERYFTPGRRNGPVVYEWRLKPMAEEAIYKRLDGLVVSMRSADYLQLPERIDNRVEVVLDKKARKAYDAMEKSYLLELADTEITAANAAVVAGKLMQLANGAAYDEDHHWHWVHDGKLDALEEIVESHAGENILVYYAFRSDLERLLSRFKSAKVLKDARTVEEWNSGKIRMLLCHPDSAGHGLNLQNGGRLIVWFGITWSLEKWQQANARLHRQGQTKPVIVHTLIAKGTIDEQVMAALAAKADTQRSLMDAVKARLEVVRNDA